MAQTNSQPLLELWTKQMEEASGMWLRMVGQGQIADPQAFWRPFMEQGLAVWSKMMSQGPTSVDPMGQWKQFLDQWIAAWSKVFEQAMGTEAFAQVLGKQLETFLNAGGPVKKAAEQQVDIALAGLGLPSRGQVIALAQQVIQLEDKIDGLEDRLDRALAHLERLAGAAPRDRA